MNLINKISNWYFTRNALPYWCILALDCLCVMFAGMLHFYLENGGDDVAQHFWQVFWGLMASLVCYVGAFRLFHTYSGIIRYSSFIDLLRTIGAMLTASVLVCVLHQIQVHIGWNSVIIPYAQGVAFIFVVGTMMLWFIRIIVKNLYDTYRTNSRTRRAFVYGALQGGVALAKSIINSPSSPYKLAGIVSTDAKGTKSWVMGIKVTIDSDNLVREMEEKGATVLLVSPLQTEHFRERTTLIDELIKANITIMMMPAAEEWDGKSDLTTQSLREVQVEDLLPRDKIEVDMDAIGKLLTGRRILITGAAGSIGSEMVRQVATFQPAEMILIDQAETPMHDVRLYMARKHKEIKCETIVSSITNKAHMEVIFREHQPEYVFHAAAYKHVPMMEDNPGMAVQNNVVGTRVIADLAVKYGTKKFVMISTDKAVNPTNVMGCSKRICEIYCQSLNKAIVEGEVQGVTQFVTTRFGNVLGSNGSVIPIFKEQIAKGGPVTVTHPDIIRYFMLIPEACKLVLEAGTMGKGGEIFVFDMGQPVKIVDLARRMITLSGAKDIEIQFSGLRDGEKLYEELLSTKENTKPTHHPKILIASVREYDYSTACRNEERLLNASYSFNDMEIVRIMKEIVPEYKSQCSKYEVLDKN